MPSDRPEDAKRQGVPRSPLPCPPSLVSVPSTASRPMAFSLGAMCQPPPAWYPPHPHTRAMPSAPPPGGYVHHLSHMAAPAGAGGAGGSVSPRPQSPSRVSPSPALQHPPHPHGYYRDPYYGYLAHPHVPPVHTSSAMSTALSGVSSVSENSSSGIVSKAETGATTQASSSSSMSGCNPGFMDSYCEKCQKRMKKYIRRLQKCGVSCLPALPNMTELQIIDYYYKMYEPYYRAYNELSSSKSSRKSERKRARSEATNSDSGYMSLLTYASSDCTTVTERVTRPEAPAPSQ